MKFISSSYDPKWGVSKVVMQHLGQKFEGVAIAHPDIMDTASEYAGCYYAEIRATIKALKYERNKAKEEAEICRKFVKAIEHYAKFNPEDESAKSIYRQLNVKIKKVNDLTDQINNLMLLLQKEILGRETVLKAIADKKTKPVNS